MKGNTTAESGGWLLQVGGHQPLGGVMREILGRSHATVNATLVGVEQEDSVQGGKSRIATNPHQEVLHAKTAVRGPLEAILQWAEREHGVKPEALADAGFSLDLNAPEGQIIGEVRSQFSSGDILIHLQTGQPSLEAATRQFLAMGGSLPCGVLVTTAAANSDSVAVTHMQEDAEPVTAGEVLLLHTAKGDLPVAELAAEDLSHTLERAGMVVVFRDWVTARRLTDPTANHACIADMGLTLEVDREQMPVNATGVIVTVARMR